MKQFLSRLFVCAVVMLTMTKAHAQSAWTPAAAEYVDVSNPASPTVRYALKPVAGRLEIAIEVGVWSPQEKVRIDAGIIAVRKVMLSTADAKQTRSEGKVTLRFSVSAPQLIDTEADWNKLHLAFTVAWESGLPGIDRQRERYLLQDDRAPHDGLPTDTTNWQPVSLSSYQEGITARNNKISIAFNQPLDGKATIVIEDASGKRIRNLVSALPLAKGPQQIEWDGLDEEGRIVPPGNYRWRAASHAGITPRHIMTFAAGPGSNHGVLHAAASNGNTVFLATAVSEGGHQIVGFDAGGKATYLLNPPLGAGLYRAALAVDSNYLYVAKDGPNWGEKTDKTKPNWQATQTVSLLRYDLQKNEWADYSKNDRAVAISKQEVGPGSPDQRPEGRINLQGMALLDGKLYITSRAENAALVIEPTTGMRLGSIPLPDPGAIATEGNDLLVVSQGAILRLEPGSGKTTPFIAAAGIAPRGIAVDKAGSIYISDDQTSTVKVFSANGKPLKTIGTPGGDYAGPYDPQRIVHPRGLALGPDGNLWISEERWTPKRYSAYDVNTGKVVHEFFGRTYYAAPGAGIDPQNPNRWIGLGCVWQLDMAQKTAKPTSILGTQAEDIRPTHYRFVYRDNRTFLIAYGKCTFICELQKDGSAKDLAMIGTVSGYAHDNRWVLPDAMQQAYEKALPDLKGDVRKSTAVLWVDSSGDGQMQPDEFQFGQSTVRLGAGYWGSDFLDLTMRLPVNVDGRDVLLTLEPKGYWPGGAPRYPDLQTALKNAPAMQALAGQRGGISGETITDRAGNTFINTDPNMSSYSPDGKLRWTYPNRWSGVHGSHNAPLPERGVMQGSLFFTGIAPLDDKSDVFVVNGNHGRLFVVTSDGLYLDEMFRDVRMGGADDVNRAGGEIFGGIFEKSTKDGNYYLQVGGNEYRVFQVDGFNTVQRSEGSFTLTPAQVQAVEGNLRQQAMQNAEGKSGSIYKVATPPRIDGRGSDWKTPVTAQWAKNGQFPVTVRAAYDDKNLYLLYTVRDASPWVNNGTDWQTLFKTGDSVDLQLGTDSQAKPNRTGPVPGDFRLLIAPMGSKNIAVLYRHRVPGTTNPVTFTSPWRGEKVDVVKQLDSAVIGIDKTAETYSVEAAIPLAELGLAGAASKNLIGDLGVIYGDDAGTVNNFRNYWSNQATALVNDVPGEIMLTPNMWGKLRLEAAP